jgi:HAD superfamily hydrolase (TIGR01549 family)
MGLDLQRIQGLCFDIDGTLSDTDDQVVQKLGRLLSPVRFLFKDRDAGRAARRIIMGIETPGNWLLSLPDLLGIDHVLMPLQEFLFRRLPGFSGREQQIIPGVLEMLEALQARYPLSVVSARSQRSSLHFLEAFDLTRCFSVVATAHTCAHTKPFPDPVLWAAAQMGLPPENCLMVGDTVVDIHAGKRAGAQTVGVLCGFGTAGELQRAGADMILENTAELARILHL